MPNQGTSLQGGTVIGALGGEERWATPPEISKIIQGGVISIERSGANICCCCVCEKICTAVAAAQFGVYAVFLCAIQQQFIDA